MKATDILVAHRGDRVGGGENSLAAFVAAVTGGALFLEGDVQLTGDGKAVMRHDATGQAWAVLHREEPELMLLPALLSWLEPQPQLTFFLEIKPEVLKHASAEQLLQQILPTPLPQLVIISISAQLLEAAHLLWPDMRLGWVAEHDQPQPACPLAFVFCTRTGLTAAVEQRRASSPLIVCYTVNRARDVPALLAAGADLVETDYFTRMRRELSHADASI